MKKLICICLLACSMVHAQSQAPVHYVGGDISLLPSYEAARTAYKDKNGTKIDDLVSYAANTLKWNACRVRIFVDPCILNPQDNNRQGEVQDMAYAAALGSRIKEAGMKLLIDFHYSDTWADPVKQYIPTAWLDLTEEELADTVYGWTKLAMEQLVAAGAEPDFVQIGNEVSYGMLVRGNQTRSEDRIDPGLVYDGTNSDSWARFANLLNHGIAATREVCPNAQIIIHMERTSNAIRCARYYTNLITANVDYDIIGLSYYPFWHGWITTELTNTLTAIHNAVPDKPIQIVETAYYNNWWPTTGVNYNTSTQWPATPAGQAAYLEDLIDMLNSLSYVNGLYYWFPEENGNGYSSSLGYNVIDNWINRGLFDPNNHKAYEGLYKLGAYRNDLTTVTGVTTTIEDGIYYSVLGTPMGTDYDALPSGVYIMNGQSIMK